MLTNFDGSAYTYDAKNRLLTATKGTVIYTFKYDGLNRQISRLVTGSSIVYNVYDGWDLIAEHSSGGASPATAYLSGAGGLVKNLTTNNYYYQDASGSTSHLASNSGGLLEWYRYKLHGEPIVYDPSNTERTGGSAYTIRHLFTGQQWHSEIGLYDLRSRYYSADIGRFLQPDPIGFNGDPANLYRYCGNNPLKFDDPLGLLVSVGWHPAFVPGTNIPTGGYHTFLILSPDNPAAFGGDPLFANGVATISGQPGGEGWALQSTFNTDQSYIASSNSGNFVVPAPEGTSDTQFILNLISEANNFPNNTYPYAPLPMGPPNPAANSNGYLNWVLTRAGQDGTGILNQVPVWIPGKDIVPPNRGPFENIHVRLQVGSGGPPGLQTNSIINVLSGNVGYGVYWYVIVAGEVVNDGFDPPTLKGF